MATRSKITRTAETRAQASFPNQEVTDIEMIDFWIVRKGEDAWKVAPEVGNVISEHPDNKKMSLLRLSSGDRCSDRLLLAIDPVTGQKLY